MSESAKRVLVVDADTDVRQRLAGILRNRSLIVDETGYGQKAVELLTSNSYAVVLLDLMTPVVDEITLLDWVGRASPRLSPVVLVLSGADRPVLEHLDPLSIHGVIRKPFDPAEVAAVVAACVEIRTHSALETMALATMLAGSPFFGLLSMKL